MPHVIFIHGIANKPPKQELLRLWESAISGSSVGLNLGAQGVTSSFVYWADVLYPTPWQGNDLESIGNSFRTTDADESNVAEQELKLESEMFIKSLADRLGVDLLDTSMDEEVPVLDGTVDTPGFEAIPLPRFIKRRLMKRFVRDAHHYLFNVEFSPRPGETYQVRDHIRKLFVDQLKAVRSDHEGPFIVVAHSMGTVIAYDCFKNIDECPAVDGFLTIGSPLGLSEVQSELGPGFSFEDGYPEKVANWTNYFDRLDPVALDANLSNDLKKNGQQVIQDIQVVNSGRWRHTATDYLAQSAFVQKLKDLVS